MISSLLLNYQKDFQKIFFCKRLSLKTKVFQKKKLNSLKKCYLQIRHTAGEEINKWLERIAKFSSEIDYSLSDIQIKGTAKLDGFAGYDDGIKLYTEVMV